MHRCSHPGSRQAAAALGARFRSSGKRPRPRLAQKGRATTWGAGWVAAREPSWHTKERGNSSSGTTFPGFILGLERRLGGIERRRVAVALAVGEQERHAPK